jgi:hypothetical protein
MLGMGRDIITPSFYLLSLGEWGETPPEKSPPVQFVPSNYFASVLNAGSYCFLYVFHNKPARHHTNTLNTQESNNTRANHSPRYLIILGFLLKPQEDPKKTQFG